MVQDLKRGGSVRMRTGENEGRRGSVLGLGGGEEFGEPLSRRSTRGIDEGTRGEDGGRPSGRARGMSGTLNELWRGLRGQSSREDIGGERNGDAEERSEGPR